MNATTTQCSKCGQFVYRTLMGMGLQAGTYRSEADGRTFCPQGGTHDGHGAATQHGPFREVHVYTDTYAVTDDGHGGSVDMDHDVSVVVEPAPWTVLDMSEFGGEGVEVTTPVREAACIIRSHYLDFADGNRWATTETYTHPYTGELEETTAHLIGFTPAETAAVVRMVQWMANRSA